MILLGIHLIVTTLDGLIALPNHCRLIYLGSTLLLVVVAVEELRRLLSLSLRNCAQALAPSLLLSRGDGGLLCGGHPYPSNLNVSSVGQCSAPW